MRDTSSSRAVAEILGRLGLSGPQVLLLDLIPLVEMAWADGRVQPEERAMILAFLDHHLDSIAAAAGEELIPRRDALQFIARLLDDRPDPALLASVRELLPRLRLEGPEGSRFAATIRQGVLAVAAAAPSPSLPTARWDTLELETWFDIEESLEAADRPLH